MPALTLNALSSLRPLQACIITLLALAMTSPAQAERADREKPVNLEADRINVDDAKKLQVFDGNVTLQQGTLMIRADRIVVSQDSDGFQKGIATGKLARFKQKRDGKDEWVDGEAERIEHDARNDKTEFFGQAHVKSGRDDVRGQYIVYDALTEQYMVTTGERKATDQPAMPQGRVRAVIQPKTPAPASEDRSPALDRLKTAPSIGTSK